MCFSILWIRDLLIWSIVLTAIVALFQLVILPRLPVWFGDGMATLVGVLRILLWAVVAVFIVVIAFQVFACLLGVR